MLKSGIDHLLPVLLADLSRVAFADSFCHDEDEIKCENERESMRTSETTWNNPQEPAGRAMRLSIIMDI